MKYLLALLLILQTTQVFSSQTDEDWILDRFNIYTENDLFNGTDDGYSSGVSFNLLYFVPNADDGIYSLLGFSKKETYSYVTFELANKIYTPTDKVTTALIPDDRPYAGWTYFKAGIHKASKNQLRSLSLQVGVVGPASYSQEFQSAIHYTIGSPQVNGWENQLNNELGVNLKFTQKWLYQNFNTEYIEASIIPFASAELGNVAINASAGVTSRFGWNIPKDFGISSLNIGADPGIPIKDEYQHLKDKPWGFSFNLTLGGSAIARDIFLDGNTFSNSHSVEKENFVGYFGFGFTARYKNIVLDFMEIHNSKQFKTQQANHTYSSLIVSYLF